MLHTESLEITPKVLGLIARIDDFKGVWHALGILPILQAALGESRKSQTPSAEFTRREIS